MAILPEIRGINSISHLNFEDVYIVYILGQAHLPCHPKPSLFGVPTWLVAVGVQ